ncbi:MAG: guanylate kinase [Alphaproteobacteria bacterium]
MKSRGILLILSSPSGAGKTTLCKLLLKSLPNTVLSVSVTTRPQRPGEVPNKDYIFVSTKEFKKMIQEGLFLEYAEVFGNYYGTLKTTVEEALAQGHDVLFDVDWQGTQQLTQKMDKDVVSIFILPPSLEELERRLYRRAQDDEYVILDRMSRAIQEISHWAEYDYVLVNETLDQTLARLISIIQGEKLKKHRQIGLGDFLKGLIE